MRSVLVLGGYGSFGGRICELLAREPDFTVLVGGRHLQKARAFCEGRPDARFAACQVDRDADLAAVLAERRPWLVIDAAGPFQGAGYEVPSCCLEAGCHYIDIADARAFVEGFSALDDEARAAGLTLISGASSVPALSSAVVQDLAEGLDKIGLVESAITASNRATVGHSVMAAILSYVGRPVTLRQGGRGFPARGWRGLRLQTFRLSGAPPLRNRWVAICDVPDLGLMSDRLPGRPLVVFRAGVESALQTLALWFLSWPVGWGWRGLQSWAATFQRLRGLTAKLGTDRSAMEVAVTGVRDGEIVEQRWTLLAEQGRGPFVPCLAAPLLARRLAQGALAAGAFPAVGLLPLSAFRPEFDGLGVETGTSELRREPLYRRVMGDAFDRLSPAVRAMHQVAGAGLAQGRASVARGANPLVALIAWMMGFPPALPDVPVTVRFLERDGRETWRRTFGDSAFSSELSQQGRLLIERFGVLRFGFELVEAGGGLQMHLRRWWFGPLPMPLALGPRGVACESGSTGRFQFDVPIALPFIGPVVSYRGWLELA